MSEKLKLCFVCNFASVHARTYVDYFSRQANFDIQVVSSYAAEPMENVRIIELCNSAMSSNTTLASLARTVGSMHPLLYRVFATRNRYTLTNTLLNRLDAVAIESPDIIHSHRTQPEGILGQALARKYPTSKFLLTTWGQDFVFWAENSKAIHQATQKVVDRLDFALPDNARDARILQDEFGYQGPLKVMAATGGLDIDYLEGLESTLIKPQLKPDFSFLSVRGYENATIRIRILLEALKIFRSKIGCGRLYIDTHQPRDDKRDARIRSWVHSLGLEDYVEVLHLDRLAMFSYMQHCDCYVSASRADGLPLSLLESLFFGQTPIVFNHESTKPLLEQFESMICFETHDPREIAKCWELAYRRRPTQLADVSHQRKKVIELYSRNRGLREIAEIYSSLGRQP